MNFDEEEFPALVKNAKRMSTKELGSFFLEKRRKGGSELTKVKEMNIMGFQENTTPATRLRVPMPPKRVPARRRRQRQIASHCGTVSLVGLLR